MSGDHERAGFEALAASGADDQAARSLAAKLKAAPDAPALKSLAALWLHCAVAQGAPKRFDVEALRRYPKGSLAASFVAMLDAEGFDPEPLSRAIRWGEGDKLFELFSRTRDIRRGVIAAGQETAEPNFGRDHRTP